MEQEDERDVLAAVARNLMKQNIRESAEAVWQTLQETQEALQAAGLVSVAGSATRDEMSFEEEEENWQPPNIPILDPGPMLIFGQRPEQYFPTRRRLRLEIPGQGSLFS